MQQIKNTLYVTTPEACLWLEGETVCVMVEQEKRLQIPLHHLGAIVCFGSVMLSLPPWMGSVRAYVQILELWKRSWYEGDYRDQPQIPSEGPYHDR